MFICFFFPYLEKYMTIKYVQAAGRVVVVFFVHNKIVLINCKNLKIVYRSNLNLNLQSYLLISEPFGPYPT